MTALQLLTYETEEEYKVHYERIYCKHGIVTHDGIHVFFKKDRFYHAFYESSNRDGRKDEFSWGRAARMDWIKEILINKNAVILEGWDSRKRVYSPVRRVSYLIGDFVVIIELRLNSKGILKGNYITSYNADNSIEKIKQSPLWNKEKCIEILKKGR